MSLELTKLVTVNVDTPSDVVYKSTRMPHTMAAVPVVFNCTSPCSIILSIPEGYHAIKTFFGDFAGLWSTGINFRCLGYNCPALVSQQALVFNAPVKQCPTKDDVMVTVDISITLQIKEDVQDVHNFFYMMGPERLTQILYAFQQESVRSMARLKNYDNIYDLMESETMKEQARLEQEDGVNAVLVRGTTHDTGGSISTMGGDDSMQSSPLLDRPSILPNREKEVDDGINEQRLLDDTKNLLSEKLVGYGILVTNLTITNVNLPPRITAQMENATAYDSRNNCAAARHRYHCMLIQDREKRAKQVQKQDEDLKEMKSKNNKRLANEAKLTAMYRTETEKKVAEIHEETNSDVRQIRTESALHITMVNKERQLVLAQISAETDSTIVKVDTEVDAFVVQQKADTQEIVNALNAEALAERAVAEKVAATALVAKRDFEAKMARLRIMKNLALNGDLSVVGTSDDNIAAQLLGTGGQNLSIAV